MIGAKVVIVSALVPGITTLGVSTIGANVVSVRDFLAGMIAQAMTGAYLVIVRAFVLGITTRGTNTVGAKVVITRAVVEGITTLLPVAAGGALLIQALAT